jgi:hypothetical protein
MSLFDRMFAALIEHGNPAKQLAPSQARNGRHRSQKLPRNHTHGNLYGYSLPNATLRPELVANCRKSEGSQAVINRVARRNRKRVSA